MIPEWLNQGITPVIASYAGEDWNIDLPRYRLPVFKPNKLFARVPGFRRLAEYWYYHQVTSICIKIIKKHDLNLVFSFANPQISNLLGARLKKRLGIKFVSHFSDPWYDNEYSTTSPRQARRILKQETRVIKASDKLIFVSEKLRDLVMKKYPLEQSRSVVIPHCFSQSLYPREGRSEDGKFVISHIGAFYEQRNPEILFKVIKELLNRKKELEQKIRVQLIGGVNAYAGYSEAKIMALVRTYKLESVIQLIPPVSFEESLSLMKRAYCLVVIDANFSSSPFLPSKVVDYAGSERPILGITPTGSATMTFLKQLGHGAFTYDQINDMVNYLANLATGASQPQTNRQFLDQFDVKQTSKKLINLFEQILWK